MKLPRPYPPDGDAVIRRRRLVAVAVVLAVVVAIVVVLSIGSGDPSPRFVPSGGAGIATVLHPAPPARAPRPRGGARTFKAAPAAAAAARNLPLARQVSQLFLVTLDGSSPRSVSSLGGLDWGGVVLGSAGSLSASDGAGLAGGITASARAAGHLPPLIAATQEGGPGTAFPALPPRSEPAIGASGKVALARAQALLAGERLRGLGVNMTLAPLADVDTPGGPLSGRLFSSDPVSVARFSVAAVEGYAAAGVISAPGHFPGTGSASADPDQMTATVGGSLGALRARDLIPFAAIAPLAPVIVMSSAAYAAFDGVTPASLLPEAIELLRRDYGFQGVAMSDDLDASLQATGEGPGAVAVRALRAGDDLLYVSGPASEHLQAYDAVLAAAGKSSTIRALVHDALLRVLSLKARYGLLG